LGHLTAALILNGQVSKDSLGRIRTDATAHRGFLQSGTALLGRKVAVLRPDLLHEFRAEHEARRRGWARLNGRNTLVSRLRRRRRLLCRLAKVRKDFCLGRSRVSFREFVELTFVLIYRHDLT
jgi:hypothetical protein